MCPSMFWHDSWLLDGTWQDCRYCSLPSSHWWQLLQYIVNFVLCALFCVIFTLVFFSQGIFNLKFRNLLHAELDGSKFQPETSPYYWCSEPWVRRSIDSERHGSILYGRRLYQFCSMYWIAIARHCEQDFKRVLLYPVWCTEWLVHYCRRQETLKFYVQYHTKTLRDTLLPTSICSACACPCSWLEKRGAWEPSLAQSARRNPKGTSQHLSDAVSRGHTIFWSFPGLQTNQIWKNDCCYNQYHNNSTTAQMNSML